MVRIWQTEQVVLSLIKSNLNMANDGFDQLCLLILPMLQNMMILMSSLYAISFPVRVALNLINLQFSIWPNMQTLTRPNQPQQLLQVPNHLRIHRKTPSSTSEDSDHSQQPRDCKQKSQLCKKFMETGYCPYNKRCKFAHGSHQLRKNDQFNTKYKTKECGSFKAKEFCVFGDRCNFIHVTEYAVNRRRPLSALWQWVQMGVARKQGRNDSRLLQLLQ